MDYLEITPALIQDFTPNEHLRTSTPLKNTNCTQDNKLIETRVEHIISQGTSQINQKESKLFSNLSKKNNLDINLESQEEKLILKIANKNKKRILPLNISQINTQEFIDLNVNIASRNVEVSHTQFDSPKKEIVTNIDSDEIVVASSPKSNRSNNFKSSNKNGETFDKTKNLMRNTTICTIDPGQDSETFDETQFQNLKPSSHTQFDSSKKEMIENMNSDDMMVVSSPALIKRLKDSKENIKNGDTSSSMKSLTYNTKFGTIDVDENSVTLDETQGSESSKQHQNSELVSFRSMCEELMLRTKPIIDSYNKVYNDKVIGFTQVNADVLKCVSFKDCVSNTNKIKSPFHSTHSKMSNNISKRKMPKLSEHTNESLQTQYDGLNKKLKLTSLHNTISNQPNISSSVNYVVTLSEDEDDCVLTKNKIPKDQNTLTNYTHKIQHGSTEANKHFEKVKPLFTCSPYGQIHKDMLNFIKKKKKRGL